MERSINEISVLVSNKWRLIDSNHKVPISSSLYELIVYTLTPSLQLSEKADDKESKKKIEMISKIIKKKVTIHNIQKKIS
jgi:hypothetical protein